MYNDPTDIPLTIITPRKIICPVCNGYGWYRYTEWPVKCRACKGKKEFYVYPTLTENEFLKLIKF
jgi:hypothetical protein